ncbi:MULTISPECIES: multicopper oxidase domain-containing protein [unclassified Arenibacter]|uniref:multicopper oxidase domain-containing protein n=1 Tax=unclassified Arenibacter TaxID=2615047 RepID=UPI000E34C802|nr:MULTISPECIES: multicopper oxidase domain-containing protein [unclassified Arenibacter]MCM4163595.1 copper oxidase [Arenibacter sp. A80]RFT56326.1 copper oxidase [Arenibacter sp. P308M17]|tara:strand:+ start:41265 stop:43517 length:2253 start_codon:yes stop_codon:yes gene_type:complete
MYTKKNIFKEWLPIVVLLLFATNMFAQKVVRYDLYVKDTLVNFTGKEKRAIAVNGQIPMPTLTFTEGDTAEIYVHNQLKESTSLHWHGLFLPNQEDGVPFLTQMPIEPGTTHKYTFPIIQHGTHWYHSHSGLQEQIGMYGSMILKKREDDPTFRKGIDDLPAVPIILSEWTDYKPENVHRMLHNASDWFAIKKGTTQSYAEAIKAGHFKTKLTNEWKRMLAMDVSDVYYDKFLINGTSENQLSQFKAGDKVRLQISNGGASSYFWLTYAGGKITVVANDGNDVEPVEVDRLIIGVSETYDVIVTIPAENTSYEFLATPEDRTKSASIYIGKGVKQLVSPLPKLKYFEGMKMMNDMMNMDGTMNDMGMDMSLQQMDMNTVMYPEITGDKEAIKMDDGMDMNKMDHSNHSLGNADIVTLNYSMLKSPTITTLPKDAPVRELKFELTGNMNRYVWSMDNKVLSETDKILIKKGEIVRITLYNNSMMRHPMHLHGHDFRVINGQGDYAPLKNVLDIMPMETNIIEFEANLEGDWFFHCHILYHMMAGMNRVFSYENQAPNPLLPDKQWAYKKLQNESNELHFMFQNDFATNGNDGEAMFQNTRWSFGAEWRLGYNDHHGYETETHIGRYIGRNQWLMPFIGFDWRYRNMGMDEQERNLFGQTNKKDQRGALSLGVMYTLPMLVNFQAEMYHDGIVRLSLMREDIPVSKRMRAAFMVNTDKEYMFGLNYIVAKNIGIRTHYDSDMGFGAGMTFMY